MVRKKILFIGSSLQHLHYNLFKENMKEIDIDNEVKTFKNGQDALEFIKATREDLFLIFL